MGGTPHLDIDVSHEGAVGRVRLTGELDLDGVDAVTKTVTTLIEAGATSVVIDMAAVTFLDSSGLRALLSGHQALNVAGGSLTLEQVSPAVQRVLDITGTSTLFQPS